MIISWTLSAIIWCSSMPLDRFERNRIKDRTKTEVLSSLERAIECCDTISDGIKDVDKESFFGNQMLMKATAMDMMSIGNFMDGMPAVIFETAPKLKGLYGFRCVIAHDYGNDEFSYETLWEVVSQELPSVKDSLIKVRDSIISGEISLKE